MSERQYQTLNEMLESVPQEAEPSRDLWPQIRAEIATSRAPRMRSVWLQVAAGVVLVIGTATITYFLTRQQPQQQSAGTNGSVQRAPNFDPATFGPDYLRARADLDRLFEQRIASLPPATREKLQKNLADLRQAADAIVATLAEHPSDSLLQELLMSTRQRELQLLADVSQMPLPNS